MLQLLNNLHDYWWQQWSHGHPIWRVCSKPHKPLRLKMLNQDGNSVCHGWTDLIILSLSLSSNTNNSSMTNYQQKDLWQSEVDMEIHSSTSSECCVVRQDGNTDSSQRSCFPLFTQIFLFHFKVNYNTFTTFEWVKRFIFALVDLHLQIWSDCLMYRFIKESKSHYQRDLSRMNPLKIQAVSPLYHDIYL